MNILSEVRSEPIYNLFDAMAFVELTGYDAPGKALYHSRNSSGNSLPQND